MGVFSAGLHCRFASASPIRLLLQEGNHQAKKSLGEGAIRPGRRHAPLTARQIQSLVDYNQSTIYFALC